MGLSPCSKNGVDGGDKTQAKAEAWTEVVLLNFWDKVRQMTRNPALILPVFLDSRVRTLI